jgi:dihydroxyacetone kinase DhaKLM complex PTS-EIIA-like component DhaM
MAIASGSIQRDANHVPLQGNGIVITSTKTLTGNNTTVNVPIFTITGSVDIVTMYGVITTTLGANHTAASWRINDQTAQVYLTAVGGTALSAKTAGSMIVKEGLVATALTLIDNVAGAISEPAAAQGGVSSEIFITKKTGALTQIEYCYTTTDAPTSGAIEFFVGYYPLSDDGNITAV